MAKTTNKLTSFTSHLDKEYGVKGSSTREAYEQEFETFKLGVMLQELRKKRGLTQEQLANKCGTTKPTFRELKIIQAISDYQH